MKRIKDLFNRLVKPHSKFKPVAIETPRLFIREIKKEDAQRLFEITTAPGFFYCYFDGTMQSVENFVTRAIATQQPADGKRTEYLMAVVDKTSGELIGHVSLESEKLVEHYTHSANFFMDPQHQSKGLGREAAVNIMHFGIEVLGMPGFSVLIHPDNAPSQKVAAYEGYKAIGNTTLDTTRGVEPRVILVLQKETFYEQRKNDKKPLLLAKPPGNDNKRHGFFKRRSP